ncbi:MAG: sigma-70 family RNA polymerase sigma factor [Lyngbya sp.]|nr:sigma-70 family RNA polymerase sigma factor [Lyngbya sp.]
MSQFWQEWAKHQSLLYRCCLKLMNSNPTEAEDALSQAMLKAWEKVQKHDGQIAHYKAWLLKLTRNLCIDIIRERSRGAVGIESIEWVGDTEEVDIPSTVASPEGFLETEEKSIEIKRAIAELRETLRETFVLHFYRELSHTEIAERQGISYDNVCRRIHRARKLLKEKLSGYFLGTEEKVSVAARDRQSSTPRKKAEKRQRIESEDRMGLETATVSRSVYLPNPPSSAGGVEAEQPEWVESSLAGDNGGQKILETATELTDIECVEVVEADISPCVESSADPNINKYLQKTNNIIKSYNRTAASQSHLEKYPPPYLLTERSRRLRRYVVWGSLTGDNPKSRLIFRYGLRRPLNEKKKLAQNKSDTECGNRLNFVGCSTA